MLPSISGRTFDGALTYSYVPPQQTRHLWPVLLPGIQKIKESNQEPWLPEDIYASLLHGKASLYVMADQAGKHAGFGVFELIMFPYETVPRLHLWLGYCTEKGMGHYGIDVAKQIAGAAGVESIVFSTPQNHTWVEKFNRLITWYEV